MLEGFEVAFGFFTFRCTFWAYSLVGGRTGSISQKGLPSRRRCSLDGLEFLRWAVLDSFC